MNDECVANCGKGCARCDPSDADVCVECRPGYALTAANTCNKCSRKCSGSCDAQDIASCTTCADGFRMADNDCKRCPAGCLTCDEDNCLSCIEGHKLVSETVRG